MEEKFIQFCITFQENVFGHKGSMSVSLLRSSPFGSESSFRNATTLENVVDWDEVGKRWKIRFWGGVEKPMQGNVSIFV